MSEESTTAPTQGGDDRKFGRDVRRLGESVGQLHDDLTGIAKAAGDVAHSGLAAVRETGGNGINAARAQGARATRSVRSRMVAKPATTVLIAVGVGVVLGLAGATLLRSHECSD